MKTIYILTVTLLIASVSTGFARQISKKEQREAEDEIRQQQIEQVLNSDNFIFKAGYAIPMGGRPVNMSSDPGYARFSKEMMDGNLPYFGRVTAAIGLSGELAVKFKDKPQTFKIEKRKKSYDVEATVRGKNDFYNVSLIIPLDGSSTLTITGNSRGTISYRGQIYEMKPGKSEF
jgi:hypothetical protein